MHRQPSLHVVCAVALSLVAGCATRGQELALSPLPAHYELDPFYEKHVSVGGLPVVSSSRVPDAALFEAAWIIERMIGERTDILAAMVDERVRFCVMAHDEWTTQVPEHSDLTPREYWDRRARGLGATTARPAVSCGAENLLGYEGDPYRTENILIHEFGHAMHEMGLKRIDPSFDGRLREAWERAMAAGLWKDKYASTNHAEYWAEGVQSWFDTNREDDHDHNHVNTRSELIEYDPGLAELLREVYGEPSWRYVHPRDRATPGHLAGFDPADAPVFRWPEDLERWYRENGDRERLRREGR